MKGILKRLVTTCLAGLICLSTVINSYAETDNQYVNGGGSGQQNEGGDFSYSGSYHIYHINAGVRFYVMNQEGTVITNTVDMVQYFPQDFAAGDHFSAEKFAYMTSTYQNKIGFWNKNKNADLNLDNAPGGKETILYLGNGKTDASYMKSFDNLMNPTKGLTCIKRDSYDKSNPGFNSIHAIPAKMYTYANIETYLKNYITKAYPGIESPIDPAGGTYTYPSQITGENVTINKKFKNPFHFENWDVGLLASGEHMKHQLMATVGNNKEYLLQLLLRMDAPVKDGTGKMTGEMKPLLEFYDTRLEDKLNQIKASGSENPIVDLIQQEQLYLGVEPIFWSCFEVFWPSNNVTNANGANQQAFYSTPYILYGTPSHIYWEAAKEFADFVNINSSLFKMKAPDPINDLENFKNFLESHGFFGHWQWGQGESCYMLEKDEPELGLTTYNKMWTMDPKFWRTMIDGYYTIGYGIMTFKLAPGNPAMSTWDKIKFPSTNYKPGPAEQVTDPNLPNGPYPVGFPSEGESFRQVGKDHRFNIVKFYSEKQPDGSYVYKENYTREQAIHDIQIDDEIGYKVDNYYTSDKFEKPTNPTDDYDVWKTSKAPKATYEGTKAEHIQIKATDNDTTLYIRLVSTPSLTIIKYFPNNQTPKIEEIPWIPSYNSDEDGYVYEEDKQSSDKPDDIPDNYEATNGTPENNPIIPVKPDTRIIYIKYKEVEADSKITLHQNELAHTFKLEDIQSLVTLTHSFASKAKSGSGRHGSGSDRWYCDWHRVIDDGDYSYIISNKEDYSLTSFIGSQGAFQSKEIGNNNDSGSLGIGGGSTNGLTPNLKFSIYRDKIKDNVTLYQGKNSDSIKNELSNIYITKEGYKPLTERIKNEGETEWFSTFKINYTYDTEDNTLSWGSSGCSTHGDSGSWNGISNGLSEINNPFSQANNVLTKAYLGKPGIGDKESTLEKTAFNILGKTFNKNLVYEKLGDNYIQFFPYIKMKYNTVEDETNKEAYIVSTNESKVRNLSSVETGVYQSKNGYGIDISSEQWSTHRKTMDGLKENGVAQAFLNKGLLPGGAVIKLNTSNTNNNIPEVWVGLRTYEMSIPDDLKVTLSSTENIKTTSEAKANAEQLVEDVRKNLSNYHVEKWIKEGITIDEGDMDSGASKVSGVTYKINNTVYKPVKRFGGNDLSKDSKYYLKENVNGADSSKLDVINIDEETNKLKDMEIHIYNISSDTNGKVTVKKDGVEIISANIKKDKNASSLLSNEDVKRVNERVKFVENFIASLDFEEGKDRENKAWYYEAQDGIDVVEMTAAFHLGFGKDNAIRSEVADVKLTGKLENKGDILNFDSSKLNEKTRTVQYRMSAAPANASCEKAGYIGTFNGQEVRVDKMYMVMRSRLYYMGNNTVMDLN